MLNPIKFTKAVLWAMTEPHYTKALKRAFHDAIEIDRIAVDCAILANMDDAWIRRFKRWAHRNDDSIYFARAVQYDLRTHGINNDIWSAWVKRIDHADEQ